MKNLEWWWKFSIFGRNSRILKVLAHEITDQIPKNKKISILMVLKREVIIIVTQDKYHEKNLSGGGSFQFLVQILDF